MRVLRGRWSICECASFLFGFEGGMQDSIVYVPDHCLSLYILKIYTLTLHIRRNRLIVNETFLKFYIEFVHLRI